MNPELATALLPLCAAAFTILLRAESRRRRIRYQARRNGEVIKRGDFIPFVKHETNKETK